MGAPSDHLLVDSPAGLAALAEALAAASEHALDSESNSGFAYRERLCLLQLNIDGHLWLVDLVALPPGPETLAPLRPTLEAADRRTCVHGGEFDVALLRRDFDIRPAGIWDSQQAASLLGWPQTGYGRLVESICGVPLAKAHSFYDWSRRPLEPEALRYALDDVRYLPRICRHLRGLVREADLEEELEIACQVVAASSWNGGARPEGIWRIKGVRTLEPRRLPLLVALYEWRESAAREADRPPGRMLNNAVLLSLARAAPARPAELRRLGLRGRRLERYGPAILEVVRRASRRPPPVPEPPVSPRPERAERDRGKKLRRWRAAEAGRRGVTEQAVLPAAALRHLARHGAADLESVPQLGGKRMRLYGETLRRLAAAPEPGTTS